MRNKIFSERRKRHKSLNHSWSVSAHIKYLINLRLSFSRGYTVCLRDLVFVYATLSDILFISLDMDVLGF